MIKTISVRKKVSSSILILCLCFSVNMAFAHSVNNDLHNVNAGLQASKSTEAHIEESFPIKNLYKKGDVFNIEAGKPALALTPGKIWVNLAMVLDRPLIEGVTLDTITETNTYPLKEMSILDYNETKVNLAILLITNYYIQNAHKLLNKMPNETIYVTLQTHRNSSGPKTIQFLTKLISNCLQEDFKHKQDAQGFPILEIPGKCVVISFLKGSKIKDIKQYDKTDILFSISLVGGLNPNMKSGDFSMAQEFIPFDIEQYELFLNRKYSVKNHLIEDLMRF